MTRNARGPDGKRAAIPANEEKDVGGLVMPSCAAKDCKCLARPDSRFCSDGCGVRNAQSLLSDALRHSLEERLGRERGRRLKEFRETRTLKHEVSGDYTEIYNCRRRVFLGGRGVAAVITSCYLLGDNWSRSPKIARFLNLSILEEFDKIDVMIGVFVPTRRARSDKP